VAADVTIDRDLDVRIESDASRWYAYQARRGSVVAVDSRTGRRVALAPPSACSLQDLRLGVLLMACAGNPVARLVSLPGLATTDFADLDERDGMPFEEGFTTIGRYWLGGYSCETGKCGQVYLNRRTLGRAQIDSSEEEDPDVLLGDVDTPGLALQDGTIRVDARSGGYRLTQAVDTNAPLVLEHRGRHHTLRRCPHTCRFATLGASLVTWVEGPFVYAYNVRALKTARWRVPTGSTSSAFVTEVVHTGRYMLVRTLEHQGRPLITHQVLYRASIPRLR
jgi:hypothetical protein